jgi:hypothetical protein
MQLHPIGEEVYGAVCLRPYYPAANLRGSYNYNTDNTPDWLMEYCPHCSSSNVCCLKDQHSWYCISCCACWEWQSVPCPLCTYHTISIHNGKFKCSSCGSEWDESDTLLDCLNEKEI